jgi:hypothetical protein
MAGSFSPIGGSKISTVPLAPEVMWKFEVT